jgi:hypothetical protein
MQQLMDIATGAADRSCTRARSRRSAGCKTFGRHFCAIVDSPATDEIRVRALGCTWRAKATAWCEAVQDARHRTPANRPRRRPAGRRRRCRKCVAAHSRAGARADRGQGGREGARAARAREGRTRATCEGRHPPHRVGQLAKRKDKQAVKIAADVYRTPPSAANRILAASPAEEQGPRIAPTFVATDARD